MKLNISNEIKRKLSLNDLKLLHAANLSIDDKGIIYYNDGDINHSTWDITLFRFITTGKNIDDLIEYIINNKYDMNESRVRTKANKIKYCLNIGMHIDDIVNIVECTKSYVYKIIDLEMDRCYYDYNIIDYDKYYGDIEHYTDCCDNGNDQQL